MIKQMKRLFRKLLGYCERHRRYGRPCRCCLIEAHVANPTLTSGLRRELRERVREKLL